MKVRLYLYCVVLSGLLCAAACSKVERSLAASGTPIAIIGHGGMGFITVENNIPPNSMASLRRAIEGYNADGVEVDVQLSADSVLMLFHDQSLLTSSNCVGCVAEQGAEALENCRYRNDIAANVFSSERLIRLEDFVRRMAQRQVPPKIILDAKTFFNCSQSPVEAYLGRFARATADLIRQYEAEEWIFVESADLFFIQQLNRLNAQIKIIFAGSWSRSQQEELLSYSIYGWSFQEGRVTEEQLAQVRAAGWRVALWNVLTRKELVDAVNQQPELIYTDNIPLLQEILR
ncbi:MAG: glycerophosphodiester phosphodiesterase [Bacteroidota bacterium]